MLYKYLGKSVTSVTLVTRDGKKAVGTDVVLTPGGEYDLPDGHPHIQRLFNKGLLLRIGLNKPAADKPKKGGK